MSAPPEPELDPNWNSVGWGIGLWLISTFAGYAILIAGLAWVPTLTRTDPYSPIIIMFQVGIWQWIYVIPFLIWLRHKRRFETAKGLLMMAGLIFGVDAICSGLLFFK